MKRAKFALIAAVVMTVTAFCVNEANISQQDLQDDKEPVPSCRESEDCKTIVAKVKATRNLEDLKIKASAKVREPKPKEPEVVYQGMTMDDIIKKLNKNLKSTLSGTGRIFAEYSLKKKIDPFLVVAITLHETGCAYGNCSSLVKYCNNVGGMKGYGCGGYAGFNSIEEGIKHHINNIYNGYVSRGLTTAELMNPVYAEDKAWASKVNKYINQLKKS